MFFERPDAGERCLLVCCEFTRHTSAEPDQAPRDSFAAQAQADEFVELARAAGADVHALVHVRRAHPSARFLIGSGKLAEIASQVAAGSIELVLFDHALSPSQERNIEKELCCRVLDRTGLILDIFARRARSHAGKLQVELAQLEHMSTRLVRGWTHLERQKGGIGLRGPGETQLETDRRLLRERIKWINRRLERVSAQRVQARRSRQRAELPTVALVGYTNAGKSTLFNRLSASSVYAADQLFATLDPSLRAIEVEHLGKVILVDTVGFVRDLPHQLVAAFKATLEEAAQADLLLHVIDASAAEVEQNISAVETVLADIGAAEVPCVQVMNKIDLMPSTPPRVDVDSAGVGTRIWLSAHSGAGVEPLGELLCQRLADGLWRGQLALGFADSKLRARLYDAGAVVSESCDDAGGCELELCYPRQDLERLLGAAGIALPPG